MDLADLAALLAAGAACCGGVSIALEALAMLRVAGDQRGTDDALQVLPLIEEQQLLWDATATPHREPFDDERASDDIFRVGRVLSMFGVLAFGRDDLRRARSAQTEARIIFRNTGDRGWEGLSLWYLAMVDAAERQWPEAAVGHRESLRAFFEGSEPSLVYKPLIGLASVATEMGRPAIAAWLLGSADEQLRRFGGRLFPFELPAYERSESLCRGALGETDFTAARYRGQKLGADEWFRIADAVVVASGAQRSRPSRSGVRHGGVLTAREQDVLRLLAEGRSNPEIADALFVGVGTAKTHVEHILAKLGVSTRAAAATYAVRQGLV